MASVKVELVVTVLVSPNAVDQIVFKPLGGAAETSCKRTQKRAVSGAAKAIGNFRFQVPLIDCK